MKKHVVALDSSALAQLMAASIFLLGHVFLVGAVVGFAVYPDRDAGVSAAVIAETSSLAVVTEQECLVTELDAKEAGDRGPVENVVAIEWEGRPRDAMVDVDGARVAVVQNDRTQVAGVEGDRPAASGAEYAVQVGVFGVEANVTALTADLRRRGYDPLVVAMRNRSGQWLQRVHVSVFGRRESAVMAARSFREKEGMGAIVVRYTEGTP